MREGYASSAMAGDNVDGPVIVDTSALKQKDSIQVHNKFTAETFHGDLIGDLEDVRQRVMIHDDAIRIPFSLDSTAYIEKDVNSRFTKVVVIGGN